jgi:uncharacterized protein
VDVKIEKNVGVVMRDGVRLGADVYRPEDGDPVPAVLFRLPYDREYGVTTAEVARFLRAGYAVVSQDTRGRFASGGVFTPFVDEADDGEDTIAWVAAQPWCSGDVAMGGQSYVGATQWMAAARTPPALKAIAPQITSDSYFEGWAYQGGAFQLGFLLCWAMGYLAFPAVATGLADGTTTPEQFDSLVGSIDRLEDLYRHTPLSSVAGLREVAPYYLDWLAHPSYDQFWRDTAPRERYEAVTVPSLNIGGWYDCFLGGTLANYRGMKERGGSAGGRRPRLVIGPWSHGLMSGEFTEHSFGLMANSALADLTGEQIRFFDRHVKGMANGLDDEPPVKLFVMGANVWRQEEDWPLPGTRFTPYYLHSAGHANTSAGDGKLTTEPPDSEPEDMYLYDPRDPVPTVGGQTFLPGFPIGANAGPRDQRSVELRDDVLVYTTAVLDRDIEVTGPVEVVLHASSSALDTDFTGKLVDLHPDGRAVILTEGILRARYRDSLSEPTLLEPGEVYELRIDLWATANLFRAGHRIGLEVSSSNFPRFDRNLNTGGTIGEELEADAVQAVNRVYHDAARPSRVMLPAFDRS